MTRSAERRPVAGREIRGITRDTGGKDCAGLVCNALKSFKISLALAQRFSESGFVLLHACLILILPIRNLLLILLVLLFLLMVSTLIDTLIV